MGSAIEKLAALCQRVGHAIADHESPARSCQPQCKPSLWSVNPTENEGDVRTHRAMEEPDVLQGLAKRATFGVDLAPAAEDGDRTQTRLPVNPIRPKASVRFEEAPSDIRDCGQAGLAQLVIE